MGKVQEATEALVAAIEESGEYGEYLRARQLMEKYPELKAKADEFRRRNYEMQNGGGDLYEEGERLRRDFADTLADEAVREFLDAENALCRILRQVNVKLLQRLEFEPDM